MIRALMLRARDLLEGAHERTMDVLIEISVRSAVASFFAKKHHADEIAEFVRQRFWNYAECRGERAPEELAEDIRRRFS